MTENNSQETAAPKIAAETAESGTAESPEAAELQKWKNDYLYLRADFDNYKKSVIKERSDLLKYGSERVFVDLLEVVDNFDRALNVEITKDNLDSVLKGIRLIHDEMKAVLTRFGVQELPALGQKFDPNIHNALSTEPTDKFPSGHISQVFKKPYKLYERTIRPGHVVIAVEPKNEKENG